MDAILVGVSKDSVESHKRFAAKYDLKCYLLADPHAVVIKRLGIQSLLGGTARRTTFVIDKSGIVRHIFENVSARGHADAVLAAVAAL